MTTLTREEIALRIFCALLQSGAKIDLWERLGEKQIKVSFTLADTFIFVRDEEAKSDLPEKELPRNLPRTEKAPK